MEIGMEKGTYGRLVEYYSSHVSFLLGIVFIAIFLVEMRGRGWTKPFSTAFKVLTCLNLLKILAVLMGLLAVIGRVREHQEKDRFIGGLVGTFPLSLLMAEIASLVVLTASVDRFSRGVDFTKCFPVLFNLLHFTSFFTAAYILPVIETSVSLYALLHVTILVGLTVAMNMLIILAVSKIIETLNILIDKGQEIEFIQVRDLRGEREQELATCRTLP